jgi:hypothetical protein
MKNMKMTSKRPLTKKIKKRDIDCCSDVLTVNTKGYTEKLQYMSNLLLAYMYHLNRDYSKYISFGYCSKNLEPTILLHTVGQCFLELNCLEYTNIILVSDKINEYFHDASPQQPTDGRVDNRYMDIKIAEIDGAKTVMFQRIDNQEAVHTITLNEAEWTCMNELMVFFNALTLWYKSSASDVKVYYQHYLKLCADSNRMHLSTSDFYTPNDISNGQFYSSPITFNYSRLFYEIGIFCRPNIFDNCLKNLYSTIC